MHSKDRYWPVVAGIWFGLTLLFLATLLGIIVSFDFSLPELIHGVDWLSLNTYAQITLFLALLTAIYRFGVQYAVLARRRERIRRQALAGDEDAMPAASSTNDSSPETTAETLQHEPLTLRWANGNVVTASQEGLHWQRPKKRDVLLAWTEARLLEVWEAQALTPRKKDAIFEHGYCLYASANKYVEWTDAPESQIAGERLSWEQKEQLQEALLANVTAHTSLLLRVVPKRHSEQDQQRPMTLRQKISLAGLGLGLFIASIPLGAGILALVAPLTHSFALNLYAAIVYGGIGLVLVGVIVKGLFDLNHPRTPDPISPPYVALPYVPSAALDAGVAIRFGERLRDRLIWFLLLVASLVSNGYLIFRAIQDFSIGDLGTGTLADAHKLGLGLLMICAFIGSMFAGVAAFSRPTVVVADAEGLHQGKGKKRESISWADVAILFTKVSKTNELTSLSVLEEPPQSKTISWRADARWVRRPDGVSPNDNAGAQFAAHRGATGGGTANDTVGVAAFEALCVYLRGEIRCRTWITPYAKS